MKAAKVAFIAAASGVSAQVYSYPPPPASSSPSSMSMMASSMMVSSTGASSMMTTSMPVVSPMTTSYTTVTYETCIDEPPTMVTVTNGYTAYYCPLCDNPRAGYTTIYQTVYQVMCPVCPGYTSDKTYTVTETCPGTHSTPVFSRTMTPTGYIPQGFTTTVTVCTACGEKDITATLTVPCEPTAAPSGMPMVPATATGSPMPPAPAAGMSPPPAGSMSPPPASGMPPAAGGSGAGSPDISGSAPTASPMAPGGAPTEARLGMTETLHCTEAKCPGGAPATGTMAMDQGGAPAATGSYPTNYRWGNTSNITPYTGDAAALSLGAWSGFLAMLGVAAGAFLL